MIYIFVKFLEPSDELTKLKKCIAGAKDMAQAVNTAKCEAENARRTHELFKRLDTRDFDRLAHTVSGASEFKNFDLRRYRLVHEGSLTWRLGRNKVITNFFKFDLHRQIVSLYDLYRLYL